MNLKDYLSSANLTFEQFAKQIGVSHARTVQRYVTGERIPDREIMAKIATSTRGLVTANDFYAPNQAPNNPVMSPESKVAA